MTNEQSIPVSHRAPPPPNFTFETDYNPAGSPAGHALVLVVDDNVTDVWLVMEAFNEIGLTPDLLVAADGEEALTVLDRIEANLLPCPQLVVLDLNLPKVNGFQVLKRIRSSPKFAGKPVAIFTSSNTAADKQEADRLGASAYIGKPSNLSVLPQIGKQLGQLIAESSRPH